MSGGEGARRPIPLLVIAGPTAAGKTEIALQVAERVGGEIVSADSMQIYQRMDIGTAKPTAEERARAPIHLIDFVPPDGEYTVSDFCRDAARIIAEIDARGRLPILCGGTGLYIRALTEGFDFPIGPPDKSIRARLWAEAQERGPQALHARLARLDPAAAARIEPGTPAALSARSRFTSLPPTPPQRRQPLTPSRPLKLCASHVPRPCGSFIRAH